MGRLRYNKNPKFLNIFKAVVVNPATRFVYSFEIEGAENLPERGPAVIVCKHQSWVDLFAVCLITKRAMNYAAKKELFENLFGDFPGSLLCHIGAAVQPSVAKGLEMLGAFPLDREHPAKVLSSFKHVSDLMKEDEFLVLFPEGKTVKDRMGEFKPGFINLLLKMQLRSKKQISFVPVGISYGKKRSFRKKMLIKIGEPIKFQGCDPDATDRIKEAIEDLTDFGL